VCTHWALTGPMAALGNVVCHGIAGHNSAEFVFAVCGAKGRRSTPGEATICDWQDYEIERKILRILADVTEHARISQDHLATELAEESAGPGRVCAGFKNHSSLVLARTAAEEAALVS
jgi:hypothetical protein